MLGVFSVPSCMTAHAPSAVAASEKEGAKSKKEDPDAPSKDPLVESEEAQEDKKEGDAPAKKRGKSRHGDQGRQSVDLAVSAKEAIQDAGANAVDPGLALARRPDAVKEAQEELTQDYRTRLATLQERHLELNRRNKELSGATKDLMSKLDEISALEDRLQRELGIGKARREYRGQRIKSLANLIMTMPPQSGARILSNMSEKDAQEIVLGMAQKSERKAAKILAQMPPNKAADLGKRYLAADKHIKGSDGLLHKDEDKKGKAP